MTRLEIYNKLKELNLVDAANRKFGKNFTQVKSSDLEAFLNENSKCTNKLVLKGESFNVENVATALAALLLEMPTSVIDRATELIDEHLYEHLHGKQKKEKELDFSKMSTDELIELFNC